MSKLDFFQRLDIYDINGDTVSKKTFNAVKELQEQNKNLEYESKKKDLIIENLTVFLKKYQNCEDAYTYREIQNEIYLDVHDYLNFII